MLLRRLRWIIGFNHQRLSGAAIGTKRLPNVEKSPPVPPKPPPLPTKKRRKKPMLEAVHEVAIYIHRFHNLDLFQQGWYQIKITLRWEDDQNTIGTPARVVQYEVPDLGSAEYHGVWKIDDEDHSFTTQPFRIRYARQDVLLSVMVSFNLALGKFEGPPTSAVILKFELLYAPISVEGSVPQITMDPTSAAVHEFRIPPKALIGLHTYCPVHFDAFHSVLMETTVHITLLNGFIHSARSKVPSDPSALQDVTVEIVDKSKQVMLVRALLTARDILLEELKSLRKEMDQTIDMSDIDNMDDSKSISSWLRGPGVAVTEVPGEATGEKQMSSEISNGVIDIQSDEFLQSLSPAEILNAFNTLGSQVLYLWNSFLKLHRAHTKKILEHLHDLWANDRKAEWSIWMVHSKVDMHHHYINSMQPVLRKLTEDPAQSAAMRADLHRRSIEQMRINNRSIQDMHIFGDPLCIPIIIVERVINAPLRTSSGNSYFNNPSLRVSGLLNDISSKPKNKLSDESSKQSRVLKIVVFVHGFQGHHLDLRLVRNQWLLLDPKIEVLMSEANEDKTSGDFREMGQRLAQEVTSFVKKKMDKASRTGHLKSIKISFVGHSIGNIILRTALTEEIMEPYLRYLYTYLSVSGPHLGYLYSSNSLFNSGLWLLKKLKSTQCIHQLTYTDDPDLQNTFFYKLSKQRSLENFKNIVLLSSPQDGYIPYHSARIESCMAASVDNSKKGKVFLEMLNECLDQIRAPSQEQRIFMRCDVNFDTSSQGRNLNTMIGRAAHIEFLETDIFARFIMWSFPNLFR
ncbi:protein FAM135B-like isoform X3 [Impatiens glandulifera]|uniref:protein FAM135B-like isoform X2 n=1 Tax=Impatiens glandulifera TaxID=253017 RepID=UPI001FB1200B|nr:protein FAM135B-like isoform X2 [Impatiens glandulifera]XP_047316749.1 protein FAM135B-like isoform X3 [Impatiens glandulifera]